MFYFESPSHLFLVIDVGGYRMHTIQGGLWAKRKLDAFLGKLGVFIRQAAIIHGNVIALDIYPNNLIKNPMRSQVLFD